MRHHQHHRGLPHPPWMEDVLAWLVIGLVVLLNVILMWRIATATV
ncbi:hypothetical protein [Phenylobacterium sp.]|nr:hypothetical protein [Phenylobacterium sp.]HEX3364755.1 hypothetical protein [Phenylobacterium sp.]